MCCPGRPETSKATQLLHRPSQASDNSKNNIYGKNNCNNYKMMTCNIMRVEQHHHLTQHVKRCSFHPQLYFTLLRGTLFSSATQNGGLSVKRVIIIKSSCHIIIIMGQKKKKRKEKEIPLKKDMWSNWNEKHNPWPLQRLKTC